MPRSQQGSLLAILAFTLWGGFPFYFKAVTHIEPLEVLANRILWATICLLLLIVYLKRYWQILANILRNKNNRIYLTFTTLLIASNWGFYIWAVDNNRLFEASLGYYINPLFNVFLGFILLNEKLNKTQWSAVMLAAIGVSLQIISLGKVPWIALVLAVSFGLYGFFHKKMNIDSIPSLFIETCLLLPVALLYLAWLAIGSESLSVEPSVGPLSWSRQDWLLLSLAGPVTIIPLLLFTAAAKRITYSALGFFQYITPSILFLLALFYYREPFSNIQLITFILIWLALLILSVDRIKRKNSA